jgi:hypothetical protein
MTESLKDRLSKLHTEQKRIESAISACYAESLEAPKEDKACADWMARALARPMKHLEFPCEISGIAREKVGAFSPFTSHKPFTLVAIRPCDKELNGKTFLGIYVGDIAHDVSAYRCNESGVLTVGFGMHNPAIWVPELERIVWGCESWWGKIESEEQLRQITDEDIGNIWYVKMLSGAQVTEK